jgi:hypothetical protein
MSKRRRALFELGIVPQLSQVLQYVSLRSFHGIDARSRVAIALSGSPDADPRLD